MHMQVRIVASMPCYSESNVNEQRGRGVFKRSIEGLQALNRAGYGQPGTGLHLDLVYNPNGAFLAPPSSALQVRHYSDIAPYCTGGQASQFCHFHVLSLLKGMIARCSVSGHTKASKG